MNSVCRITRSLFRPLCALFIFFALSGLATGCQSRKTIVNSLDEKEANEIIVFLAGKGIEVYKVQATDAGGVGGNKAVLWDIAVDSSKSTEAMAYLNMAGLPRRRGMNLLDIFNTGGLVPSDMQEKIKYQAGLAEQIASTIRKIDGILDADVQISFPEEDPLNPKAVKEKVTASVYVKHNGVLDDPNSHLITKIKRLVSGSVPSLDFDNVTVIPDRARYAESDILTASQKANDPQEYVKIWTILLAKESVTRFQIIFFSFFLLTLLLGLNLLWVLWKCYPLLRSRGGMLQLFKLAAIPQEPLTSPAETVEKKEEKTEEEKADKEEPKKEGSQDTMETT